MPEASAGKEENRLETDTSEQKKRKPIRSSSLRTLISRWKDGTFGEILDDWKWIFSYSVRYKGAILFYIIIGIVSTTFSLVSAVMSKHLIDIITGYQYSRLWFVIAAMVSAALLSLLLRSVLSRITLKIGLVIGNDIRADIFDKLIDADWLAISQYKNGDILSRFNDDISVVSRNAVSWLPTIIVAVYNFLATFILLVHYDVIMALIAFTGAPFVILMSRMVVRKQREYGKKVRETGSGMMSFETETFYNFDTIKSFGIADRYSSRMREWQEEYKDVSLRYNLFTIRTNVMLSIIARIVTFIAFGYALFRLWTHDITYGTMTLFLEQRRALGNAFNNVLSIVPDFLNSSISAHRIRELVELPKEKHISRSTELDPYIRDGFSVEMKDVDFSYVTEEKVGDKSGDKAGGDRVISNSSFIASPGEIVALVGPSGEGKTTMIRLILGLIHPEEGYVHIQAANGQSVSANADTRHLFAYVPQGNTILSGTIADNLRMVREEASDEELKQALELSCAWEFVSRMENGMYAQVGERGRGLSEGQAQRIAIARAILRDAPILLLDEATSALDTATERRVLRNIIQQHPNKTVIVTTHRPSVLSLCQRVYRVIDRRVVELDEEEAERITMDF